MHSSCNYFVWYGAASSPFINTCFLLDQKCDPETECLGCVSGEPYCEVCSLDQLTCTIDAENFIEMIPNIYEEKQCQDLCSLNDHCHFYTKYKDDSDEFPSTCILLRSCDTFQQCKSCRTGPKVKKFLNSFLFACKYLGSFTGLSRSSWTKLNSYFRQETINGVRNVHFL